MHGAEGETSEQIQRGLNLSNYEKAKISDRFQNYFSKSTSTLLLNANCLYVMDGHTIKKNVEDVLKGKFNFDIQNLNFAKSADSALTINRFIEKQTKNEIKNVVDPNALNGDTRLVIVNVIYFKAGWKQKFDKQQTCKKDFYVNRTKTIQVDYMKRKDRFMLAYLEDLDAKALELKYTDAAYSFIIILPNERTGLPALESSLIGYDPEQIIKKLKEIKVDVTIPKFDIESRLSLKDTLKTVCSIVIWNKNIKNIACFRL